MLGVTSYGDLTSFAQQQSRASAFILSIDDEEFSTGEAEKTIAELRAFVMEIRCRNEDIPIFLHGETRTSRHIPNDVLRELHGFIHMCSRIRPHACIYCWSALKAFNKLFMMRPVWNLP